MFANFSSIGTLLSLGMLFSVVTFVAGCAVGAWFVRSDASRSGKSNAAARARLGNDAFGRTGDDGLRADPRSRQARGPATSAITVRKSKRSIPTYGRWSAQQSTIATDTLAAGDRADDLRQHRTTAAADADRKTDRGASSRVAALMAAKPAPTRSPGWPIAARSTTRFSENSPSGSVVARRSL